LATFYPKQQRLLAIGSYAWLLGIPRAVELENLKIADYVYVLDLGRNKFDGPVEEITDLKKAFWA